MTRQQAEKNISAVIRNAVAAEREACAKIADDETDIDRFSGMRIAQKIRARGDKSLIPTDDPL